MTDDIDALIAEADGQLKFGVFKMSTCQSLIAALTAERARVVELESENARLTKWLYQDGGRYWEARYRDEKAEAAAERALSDRLAGALENHIGHVDWVAAEFGVHYAHRDEGFAALTAHTEAREWEE